MWKLWSYGTLSEVTLDLVIACDKLSEHRYVIFIINRLQLGSESRIACIEWE